MLSSTLTRTAVRDFDHCEYFYDCTRPAEGLVEHPILGFLHTCRTCAQTVGLPLEIGLTATTRHFAA